MARSKAAASESVQEARRRQESAEEREHLARRVEPRLAEARWELVELVGHQELARQKVEVALERCPRSVEAQRKSSSAAVGPENEGSADQLSEKPARFLS